MKARRAGVIVNIGSVNGLSAFGDPAYSAARPAHRLTQALAMELGLQHPREHRLPGHRPHADLGRAARARPRC